MSTELIVNASLPETRIALTEDGEIQEILIERASGKGIVGNIYKGRVTRVLPGMQAAFVDIGLEKAAFLYVDDVFVHSNIWAEEEGDAETAAQVGAVTAAVAEAEGVPVESIVAAEASAEGTTEETVEAEDEGEFAEEREFSESEEDEIEAAAEEALSQHPELLTEEEAEEQMAQNLDDFEDEEEDDEGNGNPVGMGPGGDDEDNIGNRANPPGTVSPKEPSTASAHENERAPTYGDEGGGSTFGAQEPTGGYAGDEDQDEGDEAPGEGGSDAAGGGEGDGNGDSRRRRHRRGRRGGRNRRRGRERAPGEGGENRSAGGQGQSQSQGQSAPVSGSDHYPDSYYQQVSEAGEVTESDRAMMGDEASRQGGEAPHGSDRPEGSTGEGGAKIIPANRDNRSRPEFKEQRSRDRRIKPKQAVRPSRANVSIQDLLKEGQEVIVQVAKDPIATKGARLTCHISLPGRHLVCMPTIDHVGVSRRIDNDSERRKLRDYVDRNRPKNLGFIVRTATAAGKVQSEKRIQQDIEYLSALWSEIKEKANAVTAPALVYEDLNPVLRAIRDWVNEDIDKIVVDSRYHYNDIQRFVSHFMPTIKQKVELYQGDIPIFDAYNISTELARALERKVWLKSGGYIVIDQAEALVAIDVNTGRFVGKKSLEDTILKTNLEAVKEIAYQLRLRNCGGIIILDLIDMEKEENKFRVYRALEEELKKDRSRPQILKISELGLIEMTRKRTRDTMVRALCDSCTQCEGKGFIKSKQTVAYEILRDLEREGIDRDSTKILVQAHPDVVDALAIDERETLDQLERRYRKQIFLQAVADFHMEQFEVVNEKRNRAGRTDEQILSRARESSGTSDPRDRRGRRGERGKDRGRDRNRNGGGGNKDEERQSRRRDGRQEGRHDRHENRGEGRGPKPIQPVGEHGANGPEISPQPQRAVNTEDMTEEDRLAFLRAQAAQDAALAGAGGGEASGNRQNAGGQGQRFGGGGRRDRDRGRRRRGRGRFQGGFRGDRAGGEGAPASEGTSSGSGGGEGSGGEGGGSGGGSGGGGDHSTPPAV